MQACEPDDEPCTPTKASSVEELEPAGTPVVGPTVLSPPPVLCQAESPSAPPLATAARPVSAAVTASWRIVADLAQRTSEQRSLWSPSPSPAQGPAAASRNGAATPPTPPKVPPDAPSADSSQTEHSTTPLYLQPRLSPPPSPLFEPSTPAPYAPKLELAYRYSAYATHAPLGVPDALEPLPLRAHQPIASSYARRCQLMGKRRPRRPAVKPVRPGGRPPTAPRSQSGVAGNGTPEPDTLDSNGSARKCTLCNITAVGSVRGRKQHYCARCSNYRAAVHKFGLRTKDVRNTIELHGIELDNNEFVERALSLRPDLDPRTSASHDSDGSDSRSRELMPQQRRNRGIPARPSVEGYDGEGTACQLCARSTGTEGRARRMCVPCSRVRARLGQEGMSLQVRLPRPALLASPSPAAYIQLHRNGAAACPHLLCLAAATRQ